MLIHSGSVKECLKKQIVSGGSRLWRVNRKKDLTKNESSRRQRKLKPTKSGQSLLVSQQRVTDQNIQRTQHLKR